MSKMKVVLAYSGGLDTSIIIPWLRENYDCEVIAMAADVGQGEELAPLQEKALRTGASKLYIEDLRKNSCTTSYSPPSKPARSTRASIYWAPPSRGPSLPSGWWKSPQKEGAEAVAHGCTGKGNDQVRFELTVKALNPHLKIIAPWRVWSIRSREEEIEYAQARGIDVPVTRKRPYSMDRNLWHLSHEGADLENPANAPGDDLYMICVPPEKAPDRPEYVEIGFEKGIPVSLNGTGMDGVALIETLNGIGARNGVGIADMVENRLVGMKSRGVYETPAGTILYAAHRELETITLDRDTAHYKELAAARFAELVYFGQWYTPLREALSAFVDVTQRDVTGFGPHEAVQRQLHAGRPFLSLLAL
jgi:argininosuccinate synthase